MRFFAKNVIYRCMCAKSLHSCLVSLILFNPMDHTLPGSSVHGILQAKYWSELTHPPPGDLPDLERIKSAPLKSPALIGEFFTISTTREA